MARDIIVLTLTLIGGLVLADLAWDFGFWLMSRETLSDWLRANSEYYWVPAVLIAVSLVVLGFHLFIAPDLIYKRLR